MVDQPCCLSRVEPIRAVMTTNKTVEKPPMDSPTETMIYISSKVIITNKGKIILFLVSKKQIPNAVP